MSQGWNTDVKRVTAGAARPTAEHLHGCSSKLNPFAHLDLLPRARNSVVPLCDDAPSTLYPQNGRWGHSSQFVSHRRPHWLTAQVIQSRGVRHLGGNEVKLQVNCIQMSLYIVRMRPIGRRYRRCAKYSLVLPQRAPLSAKTSTSLQDRSIPTSDR